MGGQTLLQPLPLPNLTRGEGVLEQQFDGYQPARGRPPVATRRPHGASQGALSARMWGQRSRPT